MAIKINSQNDSIGSDGGQWSTTSNVVPSSNNTYDLGSSALNWKELNIGKLNLYGSQSGFTQLKAPSSVTNAFTLPSTMGSLGNVLGTDGTGILDWLSLVSIETFVSTGSTTWTKPSRGTIAIILLWSGGGSGGRNVGSGRGGGGGGGGGCAVGIVSLTSLPSSVTITIGAGGARRTAEADGNPGGDSSFGSFVTVTGGAGGQQYDGSSTDLGYGGDGGGFGGRGSIYGAGIGALTSSKGGSGLFGGAGGGAGGATGSFGSIVILSDGGDALFGGAGGGGRYNGSNAAGGVSFIGGNGGAGGGSGIDGNTPGGGGGGAQGGADGSGAGGDGQCRIYVI